MPQVGVLWGKRGLAVSPIVVDVHCPVRGVVRDGALYDFDRLGCDHGPHAPAQHGARRVRSVRRHVARP